MRTMVFRCFPRYDVFHIYLCQWLKHPPDYLFCFYSLAASANLFISRNIIPVDYSGCV